MTYDLGTFENLAPVLLVFTCWQILLNLLLDKQSPLVTV